MAEGADGRKDILLFVGGVVVAVIAALASYRAATVQSEAAIKAAVEGASASNVTGYTVERGIWVIGKGDRAVVYCEIPPDQATKNIRDRRIECTKSTYLLTY